MKGQWKRSAVVATVLLFVCAAVYLNWRYAGDVAGESQAAVAQAEDTQNGNKNTADSGDTDPGSTTRVLGDATLVGGVPTVSAAETENPSSTTETTSYFDTARLSRQQSRDNALSLLREASEQENVEQTALDEANRAIQTLAGYTTLESQVENLIVAKGYADCVAFMGENGVSIVVSAAEDGLQTEDVAKITDIVLNETSYTADQITIMEAE